VLRKNAKGASEYEKSLDNRRAALVSRERRAPRAGHERKSFVLRTLESTNCMQTARGAHVSRAARGSNAPFSRPACSELVEPACRALFPLRGVAGAAPSSRC